MARMIKHDGYKSVVCPHHLDIVTCPDCDIFGQGYGVKFEGSWRDITSNPLGYLKIKRDIKNFVKRNNHDS